LVVVARIRRRVFAAPAFPPRNGFEGGGQMSQYDQTDASLPRPIAVKPGDRLAVALADRTVTFKVLVSDGRPMFVEIDAVATEAVGQVTMTLPVDAAPAADIDDLLKKIRDGLWKNREAMTAVKPMMMVVQEFASPNQLRGSIERLSALSSNLAQSMGTEEKPVFMLGVRKGAKSRPESFEGLAKELESHDIRAHLTSF
jgi:hypothetical protein